MNGKRIIPGETFRTDHSNHPRPPKATTLFAVELPSSGGDTQYVNAHEAYYDLPDNTKKKIDGLLVSAAASRSTGLNLPRFRYRTPYGGTDEIGG